MRIPDRVGRIERPEGCRLDLRVYNPAGRRSIVLTNGLGCTEVLWRHVIDDLASDHRVVTWDARDQGSSSESPGALTVGTCVADLAAVQDAAGAIPAVHVGFGTGALVVLEHVRSSKERDVEGVVIIQGGLPPRSARHGGAAALSRGLLGQLVALAPGGARLALRLGLGEALHPLARRLRLVGPTCDRRDFSDHVTSLARQSVTAHFETARAFARHRGVDLLSRIEVPVLVVAAARDPLFPETLMQEVCEQLPRSRYVPLPGASHACLFEVGPIIAGHVRRFVEELGAA